MKYRIKKRYLTDEDSPPEYQTNSIINYQTVKRSKKKSILKRSRFPSRQKHIPLKYYRNKNRKKFETESSEQADQQSSSDMSAEESYEESYYGDSDMLLHSQNQYNPELYMKIASHNNKMILQQRVSERQVNQQVQHTIQVTKEFIKGMRNRPIQKTQNKSPCDVIIYQTDEKGNLIRQ